MSEQVRHNSVVEVLRKRRPWFLRLLCALSLVNGITNISIYFGMAMGGPVDASELTKGAELTRGIYEGSGLAHLVHHQLEFQNALNNDVVRISLTLMIFYLMSTLGAFRMYQLKKDGFVMYIIAQVLICLGPMLLVVLNPYSAIGAGIAGVFAAIFIALYATQLRYMGKEG